MDQKDSFYTLTPATVHQNRSAVFGSRDVSPVAIHSFFVSQDAGMYTSGELSSLWNNMLISVASGEALKKLSQELIVFSNNKQDPGSFFYFAPRADSFVDNKTSPGYLEDRFVDTFGPVAFVLEHFEICFSVFLF